MRKIFLTCLAILLSVHVTAAAKNSELAERINVAVEVTDSSRHKDFGTAKYLEEFLIEKLFKKNLVDVIDMKIFDTENPEAEVAEKKKFSTEELGELLVFGAMELPVPSDTPENFDQTFYKSRGADYVIRCEVLALGVTKVDDKAFYTIVNVTSGVLALVGFDSSSRAETLDEVGMGIGLLGLIDAKRTALNSVVNMKFISVETGQILWQKNLVGVAIKHHKPHKNFDDAWTQAYMESIEKSAEIISKHVNKYVDKVLVKGESDKDFREKKFF